MAKLDSTGATDYSMSFDEEEEVSSKDSSTSELLSQMQTLAMSPEGVPAAPGAGAARGRQATGAVRQRAVTSSTRGKAVRLNESSSIPKSSALGSTLSNQKLAVAKGASTPLSPGLRTQSSRPATKNAQAARSAILSTKHFSDSLELRDTVFSEWLVKKQERQSREKARKLQAKRRDEEEKRKKSAEIGEKTVRALERWTTTKEEAISSKLKEQREEARRKKELETERQEKAHASELASRKWREEKTKRLVDGHKAKKKTLEEEEERKQQEALDKAKSSEQAFNVWLASMGMHQSY